MRKSILALMAAIGLLLIAAGCGQKGPLYLPPEPDTTDPQTTLQDSSAVNQDVVDENG